MTLQVTAPAPRARGTVSLRKSVDKLSDAELADLRKAFAALMALNDERGFWYFAGWHGEPFNWCEHHTSLFLPWHRQYLYYFELALQTAVPGVTLPWWDWTVSDSIPAAYDADPGGQDNPRSWSKSSRSIAPTRPSRLRRERPVRIRASRRFHTRTTSTGR